MEWFVKAYKEQRENLWLGVLVVLYLIFFLPFWKPVVLGFLFASACNPLLDSLRRRLHTKNHTLAYGLILLVIVLIIAVMVFVSFQIYSTVYRMFENPELSKEAGDKLNALREHVISWTEGKKIFSSLDIPTQLDHGLQAATTWIRGAVLTGTSVFFSAAPDTIVDFLVFLLAFWSFLAMGSRIWLTIAHVLRMPEGMAPFKKFEEICGLALGSVLLTALLQAFLVVIGAAFTTGKALFLIFIITFICAMIPVVGAAIIPALLAAFAFFDGNTGHAIILLITACIAGVADNILKAWMFSRAAQTNPAISLITLLGGIALLGFPGLFIAPVVEQLLMTYLEGREKRTPPPPAVAAGEARIALSE